jgi:hypothetical protein
MTRTRRQRFLEERRRALKESVAYFSSRNKPVA